MITRLIERYEAWRYRRTYGRDADHSRAIEAALRARRRCDHSDVWFDRTFCAPPCGWMHEVCTGCGQPVEGCINNPERCQCCGKLPTLTPYAPYMNDYCDHCTVVRCDLERSPACALSR